MSDDDESVIESVTDLGRRNLHGTSVGLEASWDR